METQQFILNRATITVNNVPEHQTHVQQISLQHYVSRVFSNVSRYISVNGKKYFFFTIDYDELATRHPELILDKIICLETGNDITNK